MEPITAGVGLSLTAIAALWKVFGVVGGLEKQLSDLGHQIDKIELITNGIRERMEHINTRQYELRQKIEDIEGYLQKNTSYERRGG